MIRVSGEARSRLPAQLLAPEHLENVAQPIGRRLCERRSGPAWGWEHPQGFGLCAGRAAGDMGSAAQDWQGGWMWPFPGLTSANLRMLQASPCHTREVSCVLNFGSYRIRWKFELVLLVVC